MIRAIFSTMLFHDILDLLMSVITGNCPLFTNNQVLHVLTSCDPYHARCGDGVEINSQFALIVFMLGISIITNNNPPTAWCGHTLHNMHSTYTTGGFLHFPPVNYSSCLEFLRHQHSNRGKLSTISIVFILSDHVRE